MGENMDTPCIRQCTLDGENVCRGCFRTLDEIVAWHDADGSRRRQILAAAARRRIDVLDEQPCLEYSTP